MIAFVTTIGEPTTDLCIWSLKRNGFEVHTISGDDSLQSKLKRIYEEAYHLDVDFIRVDADVIPNRNLTPDKVLSHAYEGLWWVQFLTYDWYKQDVTHGGVQYIKKEALPALVKHVDEFSNAYRPETYLYRLDEFYNPRRCAHVDTIMGLHGYRGDVERVKAIKEQRGQLNSYDWELVDRINNL